MRCEYWAMLEYPSQLVDVTLGLIARTTLFCGQDHGSGSRRLFTVKQPPMPRSCDSLNCLAKNKINKTNEAESICTAGMVRATPAAASAVSEAMHHIGDLGCGGPSSREMFLNFSLPQPQSVHLHLRTLRRPCSPLHAGRVSGLPAPRCRCHAVSPPLQVLSQLEACGLVETIHISAAGFPIR